MAPRMLQGCTPRTQELSGIMSLKQHPGLDTETPLYTKKEKQLGLKVQVNGRIYQDLAWVPSPEPPKKEEEEKQKTGTILKSHT